MFSCSKCGKMTTMGLKLDNGISLVVCSENCRSKVNIGEYFKDANLATTFLSRQEFGHQGWILLHSIVKVYSTTPTRFWKTIFREFFEGFSKNYPCDVCKGHLLKMLTEYPPDLTSRETLMKWLSDRHNQVNTRLGKPIYPYPYTKKNSEKKIKDNVQYLFESGVEGNLCINNVTTERLGQATWMFLHSMSISYQYSNNVTQEDVESTKKLYRALCYIYPYEASREKLIYEVKRTDFDKILSDRRLYIKWLCNFHNRVNASLGKPVYSTKFIRENLSEFYHCNHHE